MAQQKALILLVEDDSFISGMYQTKLVSLGYTVELREDGQAAWDRLQEDPLPDLVLLDVVLPKKDGFEILEALRADKRTKDTPVILLTNLGQKPDIERGVKLGADDYIIKAHFTPSEVVEKIQKVFDQTKGASAES
ncbi:MAG: response regulator [Candidatus Andersenbacteria bacterium]|nr:response regulator [Candidatus Andersenbacteria bacterium]